MKVNIGTAAKELGIARETLRRWERDGIISVERTPQLSLMQVKSLTLKMTWCKISLKLLQFFQLDFMIHEAVKIKNY